MYPTRLLRHGTCPFRLGMMWVVACWVGLLAPEFENFEDFNSPPPASTSLKNHHFSNYCCCACAVAESHTAIISYVSFFLTTHPGATEGRTDEAWRHGLSSVPDSGLALALFPGSDERSVAEGPYYSRGAMSGER